MAIASMGVVALVAAIVLDRVLGIELGFISASAMRNIGLIDLALGGLMVAHGRLSHDEP